MRRRAKSLHLGREIASKNLRIRPYYYKSRAKLQRNRIKRIEISLPRQDRRPPKFLASAACGPGDLPRAQTRSGHQRELGRAAGRPPGRPAARAACREPKLAAGFFAFRRRCKHSEYNSDVEDTETDQPRKAGHLNRLQCKVMTSNVIRTSVNEGVQPRERRSDSAERRSTSRKRSKRSGYSEELRTTLPRD